MPFLDRVWSQFGRVISLTALILLDMLVLAGCMSSVVMARYLLGGHFTLDLYSSLTWTPAIYLFIAVFVGIYPGYLQTPPQEIKNFSWALSLFFLVVSLLYFLSHGSSVYSRSIFLTTWALSMIAMPLVRALAKTIFPGVFSWRVPCVIVGQAEDVEALLNYLSDNRQLQVVAISLNPGGKCSFDLPNLEFELLFKIVAVYPYCHAMLLNSSQSAWPPLDAMERLSFYFRHVLLCSPLTTQLSLWTRGVDIGGLTLLTCQFKLLDPWRMTFKRLFDIGFCFTVGLAILPILFAIAVLIKCDSKGPAFFTQRRLGQNGRHFRIIKLRTMEVNAKAILQRLLRKSPELAKQWQEHQKIDQDPRITRVGHWLRMTSLDELPQLYNVLRGEMSLVGPRPIVDEEVAKYGPHYSIYTRVKPGMTGLWQISGRNDTGYVRRVSMDISYVRNWSVYTDLWILCRTIREVFCLTGR